MICAFFYGCGDLAEPEREVQQPIITEGTSPVVLQVGGDDDHWNVHLAQWGFDFAPQSNYPREVFGAMAAATTTAFELVPDREVPGDLGCEFAGEYGTGFNVGYTTLVSSHHGNASDSPFAGYRFGLPHPDPHPSGPLFTVDDPRVRQRLYRMGMPYFFQHTTDFRTEFEVQILNWTYETARDWYVSGKRDAVLRKVEVPKCLRTIDVGTEERIWGPGLFFDWLQPRSQSQHPLRPKTWLYGAHTNSYNHRGPAISSSVISTTGNVISLVNETYPDIWHLASLPGYMGTGTDCLELEIACEKPTNSSIVVNDYQGCFGASLDLNPGSSGGAVLTLYSGHITGIDNIFMGSAWGVIHGGEVSRGMPNFWGYDDDYLDTPNFNAPEFPVDGDQTIFTAFDDAMVSDVRKVNNPEKPATGPGVSDTHNQPEIADSLAFSQCTGSGTCGSSDCVGDCTDPGHSQFDLLCSDLFSENSQRGMGAGVTGGLLGIQRKPFIGDLGLVCAPWSSWSWTNYWNGMGHVSHAVEDYLFDYGGPQTRITKEKPFSTSLVSDSLDHFELDLPIEVDETQRQRPFQMCPPAYHLAAINFSLSSRNEFLGVHSVECRSTYNPSDVHSMSLVASSPNKSWSLSTWIGDPHSSPNSTLSCSNGQGEMTVSGLRVFRDSNSVIKGAQAYCTSVPAARDTPNECKAGAPSGSPPVGSLERK